MGGAEETENPVKVISDLVGAGVSVNVTNGDTNQE